MEIVMVAVFGKFSLSHCMSSVALESSHKRSFDVPFAFSRTSGRSVFTKLLFFSDSHSSWWSRQACSKILMALRNGGKLRLQYLA